MNKLADAFGRDGNPRVLAFNFFGNSNNHLKLL
jgi:hypothetical protein